MSRLLLFQHLAPALCHLKDREKKNREKIERKNREREGGRTEGERKREKERGREREREGGRERLVRMCGAAHAVDRMLYAL